MYLLVCRTGYILPSSSFFASVEVLLENHEQDINYDASRGNKFPSMHAQLQFSRIRMVFS